MNGWIIYNGHLQGEKFLDYAHWLQAAGERKGLHMKLKKNTELLVTFTNGKSSLQLDERPDFVLFGDKDIPLALELEHFGIPVFNRGGAIAICDDKGLTYQQLANHSVPFPKTILAPKIFSGTTVTDFTPYAKIAKQLGFPLIIKENFGSFGQQVYLIQNEQELLDKVNELGGTPHLFQELIHSSYGKDIRLNVVGGKVIASMMRQAKSDFRANVTAGATTEPYSPSEYECKLAIRATKIVGADFAGVDLLFGEGDERFVCEVNSNPHIRSIYECTGVNVADAMINYMIAVLTKGEKRK